MRTTKELRDALKEIRETYDEDWKREATIFLLEDLLERTAYMETVFGPFGAWASDAPENVGDRTPSRARARARTPPAPARICAQCTIEGKTSRVWSSGYFSTSMAWTRESWDEQGNRVVHPDPNIHTKSYQCSNGHHWDEKTRGGKPYPEPNPEEKEKEKA